MKRSIKFEVTSSLGKKIRTTSEYWQKIIATKHPVMAGKEQMAQAALMLPTEVRRSRKDSTVHLYYKKTNGHFCCVVAKHLNGEGFVVTAYITDKIKVGETL